jgi:hypothetical protein
MEAPKLVLPKPQPSSQPSRMTLANVTKGKLVTPMRVLLYGVEGVGKSTFAASAPEPIFLGTEDGTAHLDVARLPFPHDWAEILAAVNMLRTESHQFKTLVIDTLDWVEPVLWAHICKRDGMPNIEAYGYGKGYSAALDEWRLLLSALERMRNEKKINVIMLAHSWIKPFKNPEGDDFDRYELKLNTKAGGLLKEWSDAVLFANYETFAKKDAKTKRIKGVSTGARLIYTTRTASYDAKNRYDLPETMPLSWEDFWAGVQNQKPADPDALLAEIRRKSAQLGKETAERVEGFILTAKGNPAQLAKVNSWVNAKLGEKEDA